MEGGKEGEEGGSCKRSAAIVFHRGALTFCAALSDF